MKSINQFRFVDHPWISFWALLGLIVVSMMLSATVVFGLLRLSPDAPSGQFVQSLFGHIVLVFLFVPFLLRLPRGKRSFVEYLQDIGLTKVRPFFQLVLITISCYIILAFCQSLGPIVYRYAEGKSITGEFVASVVDIRSELPPQSMSIFTSLPSMFEEIVFRGILLTFFLQKFSTRRAIVYSSFGFSVVHALNMLGGRDPVWVAGQIVWSFELGLFYGYLFVRTASLLPNMLFHYLSNVFVGSFNHYLQSTASIETQALYGVIFTFGALPTTLMIVWTRFYTTRWPFAGRPTGIDPESSAKDAA